MKVFQSHLLTPKVSPDMSLQKKEAIEAQKATLARPYTGGGAGGGAAAAESAPTVPSFESILNDTKAFYQPQTIEFTPLDEGTISGLIAEWLRPTYDKAIESRRERTRQYNADLDADAWARGMGASTYVTDVKGRNYGDESRDIGSLESSYGSVLAEHLYDALKTQAEKKLEVDTFNAEQINAAQARAFDAASALYQTYLNAAQAGLNVGKKQSSGKTGTSTKTSAPATKPKAQPAATAATKAATPAKTTGKATTQTGVSTSETINSAGSTKTVAPKTTAAAVSVLPTAINQKLKTNLTSIPVYEKVEPLEPKALEQAVARMSTKEKEKFFKGEGRANAKLLAEATKSIGTSGVKKLKHQVNLMY